jgi:hypothetical protein
MHAQCRCVTDPYTHKITNPCPEFPTCNLTGNTTGGSRDNSERTVTQPTHPHLVRGEDGKLHPAPGYKWVTDAAGDLRVVLRPGLVRDDDGKLHPAPGYKWVTDAADDFRVVLLPALIRSEDGKLQPAPGYKWVSDVPGDLRVVLMPGLIRSEDGKLQPSPGYQWISDAPDDLRVDLMPGLIKGEDGTLRPAPGYRWVSDAPGDFHVETENAWRERLTQQRQQEAAGNPPTSTQPKPKTAGEQLLAAAALNGETTPVFDSGTAPYAGSLATFQAIVDGRAMTIDINKLPDRIKNDPNFKKLNEERALWQEKAQKLNIELGTLRRKREMPGVNKAEIDLQAVPVKEDLVKAEKATHEKEREMQSFVIDITETDPQPVTPSPKKSNNPT